MNSISFDMLIESHFDYNIKFKCHIETEETMGTLASLSR